MSTFGEVLVFAIAPFGVSSGGARTFLELLGAFLGVTRWPVLGLAVVAAGIAASQHQNDVEEQSTNYWLAFIVACGAAGWFLASVILGE